MRFAIYWRTADHTRRLGSGPASAAGTAAPASPPPATAARKEPGVERESGERGPAATPSRVTAVHVRRPTGACTRQSAGRARHLVRRARGTSPARHQPTRHQPMRERRTAPGGVRDVAARPGGGSRARSTPPGRVGPRRSTAGGGGGGGSRERRTPPGRVGPRRSTAGGGGGREGGWRRPLVGQDLLPVREVPSLAGGVFWQLLFLWERLFRSSSWFLRRRLDIRLLVLVLAAGPGAGCWYGDQAMKIAIKLIRTDTTL